MILRTSAVTAGREIAQTPSIQGNRARARSASFLSALDEARQVTANRSRSGDRNLPGAASTAGAAGSGAGPAGYVAPATPKVGDVVVSPFNPLGLPISGTFAPTAAEVAADPARWKGTSFDPALSLGQTVIQQYVET